MAGVARLQRAALHGARIEPGRLARGRGSAQEYSLLTAELLAGVLGKGRDFKIFEPRPDEFCNPCHDLVLHRRELAQRLGVPEQQVQRWEANSYSGVAIDRLQEIADALQLRVLETVTYAVPA